MSKDLISTGHILASLTMPQSSLATQISDVNAYGVNILLSIALTIVHLSPSLRRSFITGTV